MTRKEDGGILGCQDGTKVRIENERKKKISLNPTLMKCDRQVLSRTIVCRQEKNQVAYLLKNEKDINETHVILYLSLMDIKAFH